MSKPILQLLPVALTREEIAQRADELARKHDDLARLEADFKAEQAQFTGDKKTLTAEIFALAKLVREKQEYREVECRESRDYIRGIIEVFRTDTLDTVSSRPMKDHERQAILPIPEPLLPIEQAIEDAEAESATEDTEVAEQAAEPAVQITAHIPGQPPVSWTTSESAEHTPADDAFTAKRCDECHAIDGAHAATCSKADRIYLEEYSLFVVEVMGITKHVASHARKLELSREKDEEVRAWLVSRQAEQTATASAS